MASLFNKPNILCDFCSDPNPTWKYPCDTFNIKVLHAHVTSVGPWAACYTCHDLIEQWDKHRLIDRTTQSPYSNYRLMPETDKLMVAISIMRYHQEFFNHRIGPAERIIQ